MHQRRQGRVVPTAGRIAALVLFGFSLFPLAGCPDKGTEDSGSTVVTPSNGAGAEAKTIRYAIIPKTLNNPVFDLARRGAEKAAKDLAEETGNKYEIIYQASQDGKASDQAGIIERVAASGVDGMSIAVVDANAVREPINEAIGKGVPVMCFDSDAADTKRLTFYAVNDVKLGEELARQFLEGCGGKAEGEIAILSGQASAPNLQGRVKGATTYLAKNAPTVKILPILYCDDSADKAIELIQTTMRSKPSLRGILMVGGWPLFVDNALESVKDPKKTVVVSVDALPKEREYLTKGQVYCLIGQKCFGWGEKSVRILEDIRNGKTDLPKFVDSGYDLIFNTPTDKQRERAGDGIEVYSAKEYATTWEEWNTRGTNEK